jgi:hypothetical protein
MTEFNKHRKEETTSNMNSDHRQTVLYTVCAGTGHHGPSHSAHHSPCGLDDNSIYKYSVWTQHSSSHQSMMMETEKVFEKDINSTLTQLIAQEDFIVYCHCESYISYIRLYFVWFYKFYVLRWNLPWNYILYHFMFSLKYFTCVLSIAAAFFMVLLR